MNLRNLGELMNQEIVAIFDIDGTIFRDSLLLHHMEKCIA